MSQVEISCPRCNEKFAAEQTDVYECPKCGTSIRAKGDGAKGHEQTQGFQVSG